VAYLRADEDGDGVSELLRVVYAHAGGTGGRIVERVEWQGPASIALASPILMSHTIVGRSLFDQVQDLQQIGSVITRGLLDNLYLTNRRKPARPAPDAAMAGSRRPMIALSAFWWMTHRG
jgi:hypothetical protein